MTMRRSARTTSSYILVAAILIIAAMPHAHAVDIRDKDGTNMYFTKLTRAYVPCLAPNDQTTEGIPACSPPVSSACTLKSASVELRTRKGVGIRVRTKIQKLAGPPLCRTGTLTLQLALRVSADDSMCTGGACTFADVTLSKALAPGGGGDFELAEILPPGFEGANLEVLRASIIDPDGIPLATSGIGSAFKANKSSSNLTVARSRCESPNTAGALGPACAPPTVNDPTCDFDAGQLTWGGNTKAIVFIPKVPEVVGPSECRDGIFFVRSTVRITTPRCGGGNVLCTWVDQAVDVPAPSVRGKIKGVLDLTTSGLVGPFTNVEVCEVGLVEPDGDPIAAPGLGYARRLTGAKVTITRRIIALPNDDILRLSATFPSESVDPTVGDGATVRVRDADGVFYDATLPASGWRAAKTFGSWKYRDTTGGSAGIVSASIKGKRSKGVISRFKVALMARNLPLDSADRPSVTLSVSIARPSGQDSVAADTNKICRLSKQRLSCP